MVTVVIIIPTAYLKVAKRIKSLSQGKKNVTTCGDRC